MTLPPLTLESLTTSQGPPGPPGPPGTGGTEATINVGDFCTGDGFTDVTDEIQAALDAAAAISLPAGTIRTIFFPPGVYMCTYIDKVIDNLYLYGPGATLRCTLPHTNALPCLLLRGSYITVDGLTFDLNTTLDIDVDTFTRTGNAQSLRIMAPAVDTFVTDSVVRNCTFRDARNTPIMITNSERVHIIGNRMQRTLGNGIFIANAKRDVVVADNFIQDLGDDGIFVGCDHYWPNLTERVVVHGNTVLNTYANGIDLNGTNGAVVSDNVVQSTYAPGVMVYQFTGTGATEVNYDVDVHDNVVIRAGRFWGPGQYKTVPHPGNQGVGISCYSEGNRRVNIRNNVIRDTQQHAIFTQIPAVGQINGNSIYGGLAGGIVALNMLAGQVSNNRIETCGTLGITLISCDDIACNGNVVYNANETSLASADAVSVQTCNRLVMNGNLVQDDRFTPKIDSSFDFAGVCDAIKFYGNKYPPAKPPTLTGTVTNFEQEPLVATANPTSTKYAPGQMAYNKTADELYVYNGSVWNLQGSVFAALDVLGQPIVTGAFLHTGYTSGNVSMLQDVLYLLPIYFYKSVALNQVALKVATGLAGAVIRAGLYASNATTHLPTGAPLYDVTLDASVTGVVSQTVSATIPTAGIYWAGAVVQGAGPLSVRNTHPGGLSPLLVGAASNDAEVQASGYATGATVTGALPSTPTVTAGGNSNGAPRQLLRIA